MSDGGGDDDGLSDNEIGGGVSAVPAVWEEPNEEVVDVLDSGDARDAGSDTEGERDGV